MKKASITAVFVFVLLIAFASVLSAQMAKKRWEKTVTLPNGEIILDMSGEWDTLREYHGAFSGLPSVRNILKITQEGNTFTGVRQTEDDFHPKGSEAIKGELGEEGFKKVHINRADVGWVPCKWEISDNGNKIVIDDESMFRTTLTRR